MNARLERDFSPFLPFFPFFSPSFPLLFRGLLPGSFLPGRASAHYSQTDDDVRECDTTDHDRREKETIALHARRLSTRRRRKSPKGEEERKRGEGAFPSFSRLGDERGVLL